jgi:large subunit ribosomal protein L29
LRQKSDDKLEEQLENAREEMFNLRFQKANAQLENRARLRIVRREIAQLETVLRGRQLAVDTAAAEPAIQKVLADQKWQALARFDYESSTWQVSFSDEGGKELASAAVNLNKRLPHGRAERAARGQAQRVVNYEIRG